MKILAIGFVAAVSLAAFGCKKKGGADCDNAIANSMAVSKADMAKMPGFDEKLMAKLKDLGVKRCKDDKWSDDIVKCMSESKTQAEAQGCYGKLLPEQSEKMNKAMMEVMMAASGGPGGAGGAGGADGAGGAGGAGGSAGAAMGTDTGTAGSAGAGSADTGGSAGSAAAPK